MLSEDGELKAPKLGDSVGSSTNKELMAEARRVLSGNWGMGVVGYVLYFILVMSITLFTYAALFFVAVTSAVGGGNTQAAIETVSLVANLVEWVLSGAFIVGFSSYYLVIAQEGKARLECLFTGFKRFWTSFGAYFLSTLFILLWTLLFIVPGIVAAFSYAMVYFIVADDEDAGPLEAIRRSKEIMTGNKWKFFCLNCRFIGWGLLAAFFTVGIGFLWLVPYMQTAYAKFYEDVK